MTLDISRLIAPRSIALIGAGAWTDAVAAGNRTLGFGGAIWRVHPTRESTPQLPCYRSVDALPFAPDAAFVAVPNHEVPAVAAALAARGCGGFVCFTAGFAELATDQGLLLAGQLLRSADSIPFLGPNCYGFVNFFDRVAMMPDQVVGPPIERGVALLCQSGTIALTLMFNDRSLPLGYLITVGNQSRLAVEDLIDVLSDDPRVTAFGLYLEGVKDAEALARAAAKARAAGKPIAVVKSGRTAAAARTARSHTGALAGRDSVFDAFCRQAGLARCDTLGALCETLKLLHAGGPLSGTNVLVMGASGGDMAMTADVSRALDLQFGAIPDDTADQLSHLLTDRVTIANPLDMHTYLWFDPPALGRVFRAVLHSHYDAVAFMLDCPPEPQADASAYYAVIDEFIAAARGAPARAALIASLPETMSAQIRARCFAGGVAPLQGQREALEALSLAGALRGAGPAARGVQLTFANAVAPGKGARGAVTLTEAEGKRALAQFGVRVPKSQVVALHEVAAAAHATGFPVVLKAVGAHLEHKSEFGGVVLNIQSGTEAVAAAADLARLSDRFLVEEMIGGGVAEILIGVIADPQFGQVLVLGAGGVLTELLADSVSLLPPWTAESVREALGCLSVVTLLQGYRGKPPGDIDALVGVILGVARYAAAHRRELVELDVNPVIVRPAGGGAIAVDVLIHLSR
ncbi:MAG: acetate--CoA ligase family protein [Steroidobacteraceae bacterium]